MKNDPTKTHREAWLKSAMATFAVRLFIRNGYKVPEKIRVSVGFPLGNRGGKKQHSIGQCWSAECSASKHHEIFISPELDDPYRVCDVLIHEMVHAVVGIDAGHGREFRECALNVGLSGQMTATVASDELKKEIKFALAELPDYPHRQLVPTVRSGPKKQGTRLIKIVCGSCGWTARTTAKWIENGLPTCSCGGEISPEEKE